jgi:Acetyltransferase (GNAT) family
MPVTIRAPRPGDGAGMARVWLSAAAYYAGLAARHFQVPPEEGTPESFEAGLGAGGADELMLVADLDGRVAGWLTAAEEWGRDRGAEVVRLDTYADSPVSVPFYERHMGYRRRAIIFQKPL